MRGGGGDAVSFVFDDYLWEDIGLVLHFPALSWWLYSLI